MLLSFKGWIKNQKENKGLNSRIKVKSIIKKILLFKYGEDFSFLDKKYNNNLFKKITKHKKRFLKKKCLLIIGTGGSSLGSKALLEIAGIEDVYYLENIDPVYINKILRKIKKTSIGVIVISKSGETIETLSIFSILIKKYNKIINFEKDCVIITEKKDSTLLSIANKYRINHIEHEKNIGGRYSCFSTAGLFPLAVKGLNEKNIKFLANKIYDETLKTNKFKTINSTSGLLEALQNSKYKGHVVCAYHESMYNLVLWYRQLWAESLGKKNNGLHFIHASGAVDQHSQLQMWLDGPNDLIFTIIIPKKRKTDFIIKDEQSNLPKYLKDKNMGDILNIMAKATAEELRKAGRPVRIIYLENDNINSAVELMATLMLEVPILCKAINVNPFDQPAVEKVKLRTKKLLNKYV